MTENDRNSITIESSPEKIAVVDEFIEEWLRDKGIPEDIIADLAIAVTELVNNAIKHGNKQDSAKKVTISLKYNGREIQAYITDEGGGFDPEGIPDPLAEENLLKEIGRGIFIVRSLMDDFKCTCSEGGTVICIKKNLD